MLNRIGLNSQFCHKDVDDSTAVVATDLLHSDNMMLISVCVHGHKNKLDEKCPACTLGTTFK